mmetsp:Transcript_6597/g.14239  ORF Transcript_6597/g.14239 Transcript_6597/m.14239 type:complete len:229 (-) Transcript_6597:284-970(-)
MTSAASRKRPSCARRARMRSVDSLEGTWTLSSGKKVAVPMRFSRRYRMHSMPVALVSTTRASMSFPAATVTARLYRLWVGRQRSTSLPWTPPKWSFSALMASWRRSSSRDLRRLSRASRSFAWMVSSSASIAPFRKAASSFCWLASRSSSPACLRSASVLRMLPAILSRRSVSSFRTRSSVPTRSLASESCFCASEADARAVAICRVTRWRRPRGWTLAAEAASLIRS